MIPTGPAAFARTSHPGLGIVHAIHEGGTQCQCSKCRRRSLHRIIALEHVYRTHFRLWEPCNLCFPDNAALAQHRNTDYRHNVCFDCGFDFYEHGEELRLHYLNHHYCTQCKRRPNGPVGMGLVGTITASSQSRDLHMSQASA
jgi:hypothetical protein